MRTLITLLIIVSTYVSVPAQTLSHNYIEGRCKLAGKPVVRRVEGNMCVACVENEQKEKRAKAEEDKRIADIKDKKKAEEHRKAAVERQKKENDAIAQKNKDAKANTLHYGMVNSDKKEIKREDLKEKKKEHEFTENALKNKIKAQILKRKNSNSSEIDSEKFEFTRGTDEYIISYNGMPINRIPKNRYEFIDYIFTTKYLQASKYNKMREVEVLDPVGDLMPGLTHYRSLLVGNQIHLYVYNSSREIIKGSATRNSKEVVNKMLGFYADRATAIHAINSYLPPSDKYVYYGPSMNIYIVEGKIIKTDLSLNVLEEKKGYFVDYDNIK